MSEALTGIIVAVIVGGASWYAAWTQRQTQAEEAEQKAQEAEDAEPLARATAAYTITETAKGLLLVMDARLKTTEKDLNRTNAELRETRSVLRATREELQACQLELQVERQRTDQLQIKVNELTQRILRHEQTENP